jgi:hypothetical protein
MFFVGEEELAGTVDGPAFLVVEFSLWFPMMEIKGYASWQAHRVPPACLHLVRAAPVGSAKRAKFIDKLQSGSISRDRPKVVGSFAVTSPLDLPSSHVMKVTVGAHPSRKLRQTKILFEGIPDRRRHHHAGVDIYSVSLPAFASFATRLQPLLTIPTIEHRREH